MQVEVLSELNGMENCIGSVRKGTSSAYFTLIYLKKCSTVIKPELDAGKKKSFSSNFRCVCSPLI